MNDSWKRYAAPAAFLLAVTVAVVLVRAGLESGGGGGGPASPTTTTVTHPKTTTASTSTTTKKPKPPAKRFYSVQAGDTFSVISRKTGVPVPTIERLNPGIASTSLHIGQQIRIR